MRRKGEWWPWQDSHLHALRHCGLGAACLLIPATWPNGAVDRLCSCTGCPRRFSGVAVYWFQHDRIKVEPTPGRAPGSESYQDPASLSTLCRQIGGSGRVRTGDLLLMRELRWLTAPLSREKSGGMATCTPLFRVRTGVIAIYELPPINWWRPRKSHAPDVLIASEVDTLGSPDPHKWLRREDSHLHERVQSPRSCLLDDTATKWSG